MYVGEAENLARRFNQGYGYIAPRACYDGGQQTNCRLNKLILSEVKEGRKVTPYFHETRDRLQLESELIDSYNSPWNRSGGRGAGAQRIVSVRRMGSKYDVLGAFLKKQAGLKVTLSLAEVEQILGFSLPDSAYRHRPWWANGGHSQCEAWMKAGWRVDKVQMGKTVSFIRVG
jgi:hypothetical protein